MVEGLSLGELAKVVHYSKGHLSRVETGSKPASGDLARRCDEALRARGQLLLAHQDSQKSAPPRSGLPRPVQLPPSIRGFTGRAQEFRSMDAVVSPGRIAPGTPPIVVVDGAAGVGKTAFALEWAHRNMSDFRDGVLFRDMQAVGPDSGGIDPGEVLEEFLRALGVAPAAVPSGNREKSAMYRTLLADMNVLVVLDNVADADRVRPLLPGSGTCAVLVTSRSRLPGLVVRDGAVRLTLGLLPPAEAVDLLRSVTDDTGSDLRRESPAAVLELARGCGFLPLALRIAAERWTSGQYARLDDMVAETGSGTGLLDFLDRADDGHASLRDVFSWSYRQLAEDEARAFRVVAPRSGSGISVRAAADLLGVQEHSARRLLEALHRVRLLELPEPGLYRAGRLISSYAAERAAERNRSCTVSRHGATVHMMGRQAG